MVPLFLDEEDGAVSARSLPLCLIFKRTVEKVFLFQIDFLLPQKNKLVFTTGAVFFLDSAPETPAVRYFQS